MKLSQATLSVPFLAAAAAAQATAGPYGQCGGIDYSGPTACGSGYGCTSLNAYYFQCYPGAAGAPTTSTTTTRSSSSTSRPTTTTTTTTTPTTKVTTTTTTSTPKVTTTPPPTTTSPGGGSQGSVPTTLQDGWAWVRAVASPNFHSYLQAKPTGAPGPAYLDSHTSAGQFKVSAGQVVYNRGGSTPPLYMNVENPADKTQRKLRTTFSATQNTYGAFAFQGDTLTWSVADIKRPNEAAWLVCDKQELFINTGAYLYQTPEGCFDQTIHSYGGATADL